MLKIEDKEKLQEIIKKYDLEYEADCDYEGGWHYAVYYKGGVFIDVWDEENIRVYGIDDSDLDLLYDLTKDGVVKKVKNNVKDSRI